MGKGGGGGGHVSILLLSGWQAERFELVVSPDIVRRAPLVPRPPPLVRPVVLPPSSDPGMASKVLCIPSSNLEGSSPGIDGLKQTISGKICP